MRRAWVPPAGAPGAGPEPSDDSWVASVSVWVDLILGFWVITTYQEAMKCILYKAHWYFLTSCLAFSIDSSWRKCKSEATQINVLVTLHHSNCPGKMWLQLLFQPTLLISACFKSWERVMIWIPSPLWVVLWFKAPVPGKADIPCDSEEVKTSVTHTLFFLGRMSWIFLVWAIAEEGFHLDLSWWQQEWQLQDLELWRCQFWAKQSVLEPSCPVLWRGCFAVPLTA